MVWVVVIHSNHFYLNYTEKTRLLPVLVFVYFSMKGGGGGGGVRLFNGGWSIESYNTVFMWKAISFTSQSCRLGLKLWSDTTNYIRELKRRRQWQRQVLPSAKRNNMKWINSRFNVECEHMTVTFSFFLHAVPNNSVPLNNNHELVTYIDISVDVVVVA